MQISRRKALVLGGSAAVLAGCGTVATNMTAPTSPVGLNAIAQTKGLRFGSAISSGALKDDRYLDIVRRDCGSLVAENEHKIYVINGESQRFDFDRGDAIVDFAQKNDMAMRGHVLLWNRDDFLPNWMPKQDWGADKKRGMKAYLDKYFETVLTHYDRKISSWDVVNETIDPATGTMRETVFTQNFGPDVVDYAFHQARKLAPDTQLVYNDYMIWEPGNENHRTGVLKLLEGFRNKGVPIDAFGVQSHLGTGDGPVGKGFPDPQRREWRAFMDEIVGMGYDIILSEFDVNDTRLPANVKQRDRLMADYAKAYLDMMLDYKEVKEILAWGMADNHSWLETWWPREDGVVKRPGLYDANYEPKPLYYAVEAALKNAPLR
ncbi:beta-xylanase [Litorimonas cladophorae]|uniref:Beta-xylanase n=1 Tax=Litorimonas cladophorae TaxID=1220491 RepID=A0A918KKH4_9PROT|nr:endo-1,4-beta-xylanase [Litorimonas cladophorae]GGX65029.1 beta-xylanase [Litorimonas cladophorae]